MCGKLSKAQNAPPPNRSHNTENRSASKSERTCRKTPGTSGVFALSWPQAGRWSRIWSRRRLRAAGVNAEGAVLVRSADTDEATRVFGMVLPEGSAVADVLHDRNSVSAHWTIGWEKRRHAHRTERFDPGYPEALRRNPATVAHRAHADHLSSVPPYLA